MWQLEYEQLCHLVGPFKALASTIIDLIKKQLPAYEHFMAVLKCQFQLNCFLPLMNSSQVSEEQLNDAIAQAVENSKLRKDKSQWSANGDTLFLHLQISFKYRS